ncbi:hypothetical protein [Streptomyces sp. XD-27]|uniref:hypothetical protein n=1 Tax=Streptomyces sp. XD-27 TaxID=3062779 RepID=UPI0026F4306B|nr:hypothetical protein [Streptomyces sp. XD-27]WKX70344.1 hypothetical protein Q3Y56_10805 [Streptomyces sp. XD-27]
MAASAQLLLSALSKPALPLDDSVDRAPDLFAGVSDPDSGLDGADSAGAVEPPLTSEPPLADAAPLTSEPPLATELPLTSEPTAVGLGAGTGMTSTEF